MIGSLAQEFIPMPKLDGILETALYVDDLDRSVKFYQAIFGFELIESGDRLCALAVGRISNPSHGQVLLLFKKGASADLPVGATDGEGQLHLAFAISAEELDTWEAWLAKHGVTIELRRSWERGGRSLYFRDPDGHLLELATPGVWSVINQLTRQRRDQSEPCSAPRRHMRQLSVGSNSFFIARAEGGRLSAHTVERPSARVRPDNACH